MIIPSIRSMSIELLPWKAPGSGCDAGGVRPWRNKADMRLGEGGWQDLAEPGYLATGRGGVPRGSPEGEVMFLRSFRELAKLRCVRGLGTTQPAAGEDITGLLWLELGRLRNIRLSEAVPVAGVTNAEELWKVSEQSLATGRAVPEDMCSHERRGVGAMRNGGSG